LGGEHFALSFDQAAAVGVNYIAAWCGIVHNSPETTLVVV
jgi:hypothetical protein